MVKALARTLVLLLVLASVWPAMTQKVAALPSRPILYDMDGGSNGGQVDHVIAINPDGTNRVDLGEGFGAKLSPDGQKVAFVAYTPQTYTANVFVKNIDGSNPVNVTNFADAQGQPRAEGGPSWSPNGSKITFSVSYQYGSDVMVANADGTGLTNLTNMGSQQTPTGSYYPNLYPVWSPDGSKIMFSACRPYPDGACAIYMMYTNGNNQQVIASNALLDGHTAWSPDGKKIVYNKFLNQSIVRSYVANADGTNETLIPNNGLQNPLLWSPDGNHIAWVSGYSTISVVQPDGSGLQTLNSPSGTQIGSGIVWSPDSSALAYDQTSSSGRTIVTQPLNGGAPTTVYADPLTIGMFDWAYTKYLPGSGLVMRPVLNVTATAPDASGTAVTYRTPTTHGGTAPVTVACTPASGTTFPLGATTVSCTAQDALGATATDSFTVTVQTKIKNLSATSVNNAHVSLSWSAPPAPPSGIAGYTIYDGNGNQVAQAAATAVHVTVATDPGQNNFYYVRATDNDGSIFAQSKLLAIATPLLGDTVRTGNHVTANPNGTAEAFSAKASTWGGNQYINSLGFYLDSTSTAANAEIGIYSDNSGQPGALLATGSVANPTAKAWNTVTLAQDLQILPGHTYWFAVLGTGSGTLAIRDGSNLYGNSVSYLSADTNLTSLPSSWASGTSENYSPLAAYAGGYGVGQ